MEEQQLILSTITETGNRTALSDPSHSLSEEETSEDSILNYREMHLRQFTLADSRMVLSSLHSRCKALLLVMETGPCQDSHLWLQADHLRLPCQSRAQPPTCSQLPVTGTTEMLRPRVRTVSPRQRLYGGETLKVSHCVTPVVFS